EFATRLTDEMQFECNWQSDRCLDFKRSGAEGQINLGDQAVDLSLRLGLMFSALKGPIEKSIHEFIDENIY
ncbi:MAG: polyhydroxyalkanoic acid system family protein, partial [Gammaproteobacteria bacterium]|nr:polyhydroxyalkanoic acid system family protein [Gammaproteobacteria bacterium]